MNFVGTGNISENFADGEGRMEELYLPHGYETVRNSMAVVAALIFILSLLYGMFDRFLCECCSPDGKQPYPCCCKKVKQKRH